MWPKHEETRLVHAIHEAGALVKLHIHGNTTPLIPGMIATGANILDIDHLVPDLSPFVEKLGPAQVFSGKADPITVIQDGDAEMIQTAVTQSYAEASGRCIVSAGCEVPRDTPIENMEAFAEAARSLQV